MISYALIMFLVSCQDNSKEGVSSTTTSTPDPFKIKVKRQNASIFNFDPAVRIKKFNGSTQNGNYLTNFDGSISIANLVETERLEFSHDSFYPIKYTFQDVDYLNSIDPYLKFKNAETKDGYVFGVVYDKNKNAMANIIASVEEQGKKDTTGIDGKFAIKIERTNNFTIKFSKTNSIMLKIEEVKDTVQLDVYLDDGINKRDTSLSNDTSIIKSKKEF